MLQKPIGNMDSGPAVSEEQIKKADMLGSQLESFFMSFVKPVATLRAREIIEANSEKFSSEENEEFIAWEVSNGNYNLVSDFLSALYVAAEDNKKLDLSSLDDSMLPTFAPDGKDATVLAEGFESLAASTVLSVADSYEILRAVKRSLPVGMTLPDAAVEYLKLEGIEVIE